MMKQMTKIEVAKEAELRVFLVEEASDLVVVACFALDVRNCKCQHLLPLQSHCMKFAMNR